MNIYGRYGSCCIDSDSTSTPAQLAGGASLQSNIIILLKEVEDGLKEERSAFLNGSTAYDLPNENEKYAIHVSDNDQHPCI
jgi:hypothetical protein